MPVQKITTAAFLGKYYSQLVESNIPERIAGELVLRAARVITEDEGVVVQG